MPADKIESAFVEAVRLNASISDAQYWGGYTMCGFLMRLRELYRFERGLPPWEEPQRDAITPWIEAKHAEWETLEDRQYVSLSIGEHEYGPFDIKEVNAALNPKGYVYGAGLGLRGKPVFFLAELASLEETPDAAILRSGREIARDLSVHPALSRDGLIFARAEISELLLWEKFGELRQKSGGACGMLMAAFRHYGISPDDEIGDSLKEKMRHAAFSEQEAHIAHEIGEALETRRLGGKWAEMISSVESDNASFFLISLKDTLADAMPGGMLSHIIERKNTGALCFYTLFLSGFRHMIQSRMQGVAIDVTESNEWDRAERARRDVYGIALRMLAEVEAVFDAKGRDGFEAGIGPIIEGLSGRFR